MNTSALKPVPGRFTAAEIRELLVSGRIDDLEPLHDGLPNTAAQCRRWALEYLASLGALEPEEKKALGEYRIRALDDTDSALSDRLADALQKVEWATAAAGESLARTLVVEARITRLENALSDLAREQALDHSLFLGVLGRLHKTEELDAAIEAVEKELS